jgi:hypothetical protein
MTYQIDILNPQAKKILQELADRKLISIKETQDNFLKIASRLRKKAAGNRPSLKEITKEVEAVRTKRYGKKKR